MIHNSSADQPKPGAPELPPTQPFDPLQPDPSRPEPVPLPPGREPSPPVREPDTPPPAGDPPPMEPTRLA